MRIVSLALLLGATAALLTACGKKIGDECETSIDCSPDGDRTCDRSQPGGYCTIDGCDQRSCPEDSTCIRFFPGRFVNTPCNPATEDMPSETDACAPAEVCLPGGTCGKPCDATTEDLAPESDACAPDEICLPEGACARRASERRFCAATCADGGDCRDGYQCQVAGTRGSVALGASASSTARFCAPR